MHARRTFLTMIGIIIGIAAVITIMSLGNGISEQTVKALSIGNSSDERPQQQIYFIASNLDVTVNQPFTSSDLSVVKGVDGVVDVKINQTDKITSTSMKTETKTDKENIMVGLTSESMYQMLAGRNLTSVDNEFQKTYTIISEEEAKNRFGTPEQAINESIKLNNQLYTIVGVFQSGTSQQKSEDSGLSDLFQAKSTVFIPEKTYQLYEGDSSNQNTYLIVYFSENTDLSKAGQQVANRLNEEGSARGKGDYVYQDTAKAMEEITRVFGMITYFVSAVAAISLFIAGIGVMNMMYISVSERTKEIGIRRSIGATQRAIQLQFLIEGIVITTVGGIIGYILGIILAKLIALLLPFDALVDVKTALMAVAISVLIGIVFSVFPAQAASKKNVVEILR